MSSVAVCGCPPAIIKLPRFQERSTRIRSRQLLSDTGMRGRGRRGVTRPRISLFLRVQSVTYKIAVFKLSLGEGGLGNVDVSTRSDEEAKALAEKFPALAPLLSG